MDTVLSYKLICYIPDLVFKNTGHFENNINFMFLLGLSRKWTALASCKSTVVSFLPYNYLCHHTKSGCIPFGCKGKHIFLPWFPDFYNKWWSMISPILHKMVIFETFGGRNPTPIFLNGMNVA